MFLLLSSAAAADGVEVRVLVHRIAGPTSDARIAAEASHVAGVPVAHASAAGGEWHALALHCPSAAACDAAVRRLAEARALYDHVQRDPRRRVHRDAEAGGSAGAAPSIGPQGPR